MTDQERHIVSALMHLSNLYGVTLEEPTREGIQYCQDELLAALELTDKEEKEE